MPLQTINPATGELLRDYPEMELPEVLAILDKVQEDYLLWRERPVDKRAALFRRLAEHEVWVRDGAGNEDAGNGNGNGNGSGNDTSNSSSVPEQEYALEQLVRQAAESARLLGLLGPAAESDPALRLAALCEGALASHGVDEEWGLVEALGEVEEQLQRTCPVGVEAPSPS